jgi:hypothetical protein
VEWLASARERVWILCGAGSVLNRDLQVI